MSSTKPGKRLSLRATSDDVRYAYRLILNREPDPAGLEHYTRLVTSTVMTPADLAAGFMSSKEYLEGPGKLRVPAQPPIGLAPLGCCPCTRAQIESPSFLYWAKQLREQPGRLHRKLWEWCYIVQALYERGVLIDGARGLGFAVGQESLPALFASMGCSVLATDLDLEAAAEKGWVATNQHSTNLANLNRRGICPADVFDARVRFREANMNEIAADLIGFDFLWSSCAMEHLGSLRHGMNFIINAMKCLRPGGVAVHTTELNCDSNENTVADGNDVIYRQRDLLELGRELSELGHEVAAFGFDTGSEPDDQIVDEPPYSGMPHLKLRIGGYASTSYGIVIKARS